jgi:proline dehydrogenase
MLRAFFVRLSENPSLRTFAESSALGRRVSSRFVAGTSIADAVRATQAVNRASMSVSIDNLGENVANPEEARLSAQLYHQILDAIAAHQLNANISLKLTHMGLDVDEKLAREIVSGLVAKAAAMDPPGFVRVDMEGSPYTQRTLDFVHELHAMPGNANAVGTVIQSYLRRSESDVEKLLAERIRIRLCKGAYKESAEIAFPLKSDVDANYVKLMKILMKSGVYHGLATHDEAIIKAAKAFATRENIPRNAFEFQMLHGIRRDLQQGLVKEGWGVRVYIPFGTEWYPYFMRRLAERPANVLFIAKNILRK